MYQQIILNKKLNLEQRLRRLVEYSFIRFKATRGWRRRYKKTFSINKKLKKKDKKPSEIAHKKKWADFRSFVNPDTYRMCNNISGTSNPDIVPEDIYVSDIQKTLNIHSERLFLGTKSVYNYWFRKNPGIFPKDYFHKIDGCFFDAKMQAISENNLHDIIKEIEYPVVFKPNINSNSGNNVCLVENQEYLHTLIKEEENFVVQERIKQHPFLSRFNPDSTNTIRVFVYRSVKTNALNVLGMALKLGRKGSFVDNESTSGLSCYIHDNGKLNFFGCNKHGSSYKKHPDTGIPFHGIIPKYKELKAIALEVSSYLLYSRIIGLDVTLDEQGNWRVIEINLGTQSIRFMQYAGQPFFGEFTDEVIDYCKKHHWAKSEIG